MDIDIDIDIDVDVDVNFDFDVDVERWPFLSSPLKKDIVGPEYTYCSPRW